MILFFAAKWMIDPIWDWGGRVGPIRQTIARQSDTVLQLLISKLFVACSQSQAGAREGSATRESLHYCWVRRQEILIGACSSASVSESRNIITSLRDT